MSDFTIAPLPEDRCAEAAVLLSRAFIDDPLFVAACPDRELRVRWLPISFRWSIWHGFLFGETLGAWIGDRLDGVAAVFGQGEMTPEQSERSGFSVLRGPESGPMGAAESLLDAIFDPIHDRLIEGVPDDHWYLDVIAVDSERQGAGVGGALLRAIGERADAANMPLLLMTMQERTVPLYQRHGFAITCHGIDPISGLPWWGLMRNAGRREAANLSCRDSSRCHRHEETS